MHAIDYCTGLCNCWWIVSYYSLQLQCTSTCISMHYKASLCKALICAQSLSDWFWLEGLYREQYLLTKILWIFPCLSSLKSLQNISGCTFLFLYWTMLECSSQPLEHHTVSHDAARNKLCGSIRVDKPN